MNNSITLGITKIGDLLIDKKITLNDSKENIENIELIIPNYQRPYKWTIKNSNQLLDDIIEAKKENKEVYRVGTLILHEENGKYNIVDGQQRTITFSLLLKCFDIDIKFLKQKIQSRGSDNIINNYRALKMKIKNIAEYEQKELKNYIINNCEMIVVITKDISEAFQFFDSQNARGKKLYPHDLLKAYHLREMRNLNPDEVEKIVKIWENLDQKKLSLLFSDYLYRIKEWSKGDCAEELNEHNIDMFKGVTYNDNYPFAQYYKGAYAYANNINNSNIPFVTGIKKLSEFQLETPIIAGKPFFDYSKHYFDILADIQNNDKYEGFFINDNKIVKTLDLYHKKGTGNRIVRLLFDTAILLYVDRFCPSQPSKSDLNLLDQFVVYAFVWAYSLRAQYQNVGWMVAQNYILGDVKKGVVNAINIYKFIIDASSPTILINSLADNISALKLSDIKLNDNNKKQMEEDNNKKDNETLCNYLSLFKEYSFLEVQNEEQ